MRHIRSLCFLKALPLLAAFSTGTATAHELTARECMEGSDYIRNAALSRDGGVTEKTFMDVFEQDMVMIARVPPTLRWFVQDQDDEALLRAALDEVFHRPQTPQQHAQDFARACVPHTAEWKALGRQEI
jgi:hypothetical protein